MQLKLSSFATAFKAVSYSQRNAIICLVNLWLLVAGLGYYWPGAIAIAIPAFGLWLGYHCRTQLFPYQLAKFLQWVTPISLLIITSNASWSGVFHLYMAGIVIAGCTLIGGRFCHFMEEEKASSTYQISTAIIGAMLTGALLPLPRAALVVALTLPLMHTWLTLSSNSLKSWSNSLRHNFPWHITLLLLGVWILPTSSLFPHLAMITAIIWLSTRLTLDIFSTALPLLLILSYYLGCIITPMQTASLEQILSDYAWISAFLVVNATIALYQAQPQTIYSSENATRRLKITDHPISNVRKLSHNSIVHAVQALDPNYETDFCIDYCHIEGPWGVIKPYLAKHNLNKWLLLGLGAGTLLRHTTEEHTVTIVEFDQEVIKLAQNPHYFRFVRDTKATATIHNAEGRKYVDELPPKEIYDVIIADAYSGRNIPSQLLTVQALEAYFKHLKTNGVLVAQITGMTQTAREKLAANLKALKLESTLLSSSPLPTPQGNEPLMKKWWAKFLTLQQQEDLTQILGLQAAEIEYFGADWLIIGRKLQDITPEIPKNNRTTCSKFRDKFPPTEVVNDEDVGYINLEG